LEGGGRNLHRRDKRAFREREKIREKMGGNINPGAKFYRIKGKQERSTLGRKRRGAEGENFRVNLN